MSLSKQAIQTRTSNWVCCSLGLKYLKDGLEGVTERIINKQHKSILAILPNLNNDCKECSLDKLLPNHSKVSNSCPYNNRKCFCLKPAGRKRCPNDDFCSKYFDAIVQEHQYKDPNWKNTNLTQWNTCPWEVAVCYINSSGYKGKTGATMDCAALLSIIINDSAFEIDLGKNIIEECKKARDARNDILHSSNMEITDSKREEYIDLFKGILDKQKIQSENGVKEALENLIQLQTSPLTTSKNKQEAERRQLLEFKIYKLGVIEDIIGLLKEQKSQGHIASVEIFDLLLRYHLLLQHACRDTLICFIEREAKCRMMSVDQYLTRNKENICKSLKEDAHIEEIFYKDGRTNTAFDKIELSLICKVVLALLKYGEIEDLKNENLNNRCFAIESILSEAKVANKIPLNRNVLKDKYALIQDSLIEFAMNEIDYIDKYKKHVRNECSRDFKCKQLLMRHLFQMDNIKTLVILLNEGAECIDINVLTDVREKLNHKEFKELNRNVLLDNEVTELNLALKMRSKREADLQHPEVIDYQISINCSSEPLSERVDTILVDLVTELKNEKEPSCPENKVTLKDKLRPVISYGLAMLLGGIFAASLTKVIHGSIILKIECNNCQALYKVLAMLNGPKFIDFLYEIKECLDQEIGEEFEVSGNVTSDCLKRVKENLIDQDIIEPDVKMYKCKDHEDDIIKFYCSGHEKFCCSTCVTSSCSECIGQLREMNIETNEVAINRTYSVRIKQDRYRCWIRGSTVSDNGVVILADYGNRKLKKMNKSYEVISHCNLPEDPLDVCYLGHGTAAVALCTSTIVFVDIKEDLRITATKELNHACYGIDHAASRLYITDGESVFGYDKDCSGKRVIYQGISREVKFRKLAVSDDCEKIFITESSGSIVIIDKVGGLLAIVRHGQSPEDVCFSDNENAFVCYPTSVLRVKYKGKYDIEKELVLDERDGLRNTVSVSADRQSSRVFIGEFKDDKIRVFTLKA